MIKNRHIANDAAIDFSKIQTSMSGENFYVIKSGAASRNWIRPRVDGAKLFTTLDAAVGACTAGRGDRIHVLPGHTESIIADSGVDIDVAGVEVIGYGSGSYRPTFTFGTADTADFKIAAANVTVKNLLFLCDKDGHDMFIEVTGDDAEIAFCEFREGSSKQTDYHIVVGTSDADSDRCYIHDCYFYGPTAGATAAISVAKDHNRVRIENNVIYGDWSEAGIDVPSGGNACTELVIRNNIITNLQTGDHAIQVNGTTATGFIINNQCQTNAQATCIDGAKCSCHGNTWCDPDASNDEEAGPANSLTATATATGELGLLNLDHLMKSATSDTTDAVDMTTEVVDNSVLAHILTDDGDTSTYDRRYNSMEAIANKCEGLLSYNGREGYIKVTTSFSSATQNSAASHEIVTVTGLCRLRIIPEVATSVVSAANASSSTIALGFADSTTELIAATTVSGANVFNADDIWVSNATTQNKVIGHSEVLDAVSNGDDLGYTIGTSAVVSGSIVFHVFWEALEASATCAAGAYGSL